MRILVGILSVRVPHFSLVLQEVNFAAAANMEIRKGIQVKPKQALLVGVVGCVLNLPLFTWAMYHQDNPTLIGKMGLLNIVVAVPLLLLTIKKRIRKM